MQQSKCLIYATSEKSTNSRWMSLELGYFDGIKDKMVGILLIKNMIIIFKMTLRVKTIWVYIIILIKVYYRILI